MCIYICRSVHITCRFLISGWGPALPPPCHRHKCPPLGGAMVPALFQGVLDRGLLCLEVSKSSFLDLSGRAEVSWLQRSPFSAPRHRKALCQSVSHCVLAAEHHCLVLVSLSAGACCLLPRLTRAASPRELIQSPSPDHWHGGTQPLPGTCCCCCGQRVGLIPSMLQDGDSAVPPALDLCIPEVWPSPGPAQWWRSRHIKNPALREQN